MKNPFVLRVHRMMGQGATGCLKILIFHFLSLVFSVVVLILGLITLNSLLPFIIFKDCVALCVKMKLFTGKRKFGEMVEYLGPIMGTDGPFISGANNQYTVLEVDTPTPSIQRARDLFTRNVLNARDDKGGALLYPELKSTVSTCMGYLFWSPCEDFKIDEQIVNVEDLDVSLPSWQNEGDLEDLVSHIVSKEWKKGKPLWQIVVVPNVPKKYFGTMGIEGDLGSLLVWRSHHLQNDGVTIAHLLFKFLNHEPSDKPVSSNSHPSALQEIWGALKVSHYGAKVALATLSTMSWGTIKDQDDDEKVLSLTSPPFPLPKLKGIKQMFGVPDLSSVILAGVTGAFRRIDLESGRTPKSSMLAAMTLPMPNHPLRLINFATAAATLLPTGEDDHLRRLEKCWKNDFRVDAVMSQIIFKFTCLFSSLPFVLVKPLRGLTEPLIPSLGRSVGLTNKRYTSRSMDFDGVPILGTFSGMHAQKLMGQACGLFLCSYKGDVRFTISARGSSFASLEEARRFARYCLEEWEVLYLLSCRTIDSPNNVPESELFIV